MAKVIAVCTSKNKGTRKEDVREGLLKEEFGLVGDAHADCCTHRQVSLLAIESINKMRDRGFDIGPGDFAENLTTQSLDLTSLAIGDHLTVGQAELEITQIGKECHARCAIFEQVGDCVMPREGVFARVIRGGEVKVGDGILVAERSDRAHP